MRENLFDISNKTVIITGGAGLLGSAFSHICAQLGANVIIADINSATGENLKEEIIRDTNNENVMFKQTDITNPRDVDELINFALDSFGQIDALVNSAYPRNKNYGQKFEDVNYEDFCENLCMHLGGYFLVIQKVSKVMIKQRHGNIINIASIYGFTAPRFDIYNGTDMTMPVEYAAIKAAILNITKYLASYLGEYNIRVNAISPGGIYSGQPTTFVENYSKYVKLGGRMARTEDIVGVLVFLLSDASRYITGQNIVVDGGWTL